ncbi:PIG-L deacetylase family protein [Acidobacteriota bacterium]
MRSLSSLGRYDMLFISPHLDDLALSCPARIMAERDDGKRILCVTLFSHPGDADAGRFRRDIYEQRWAEEMKAYQILGVDLVLAGLLDAPFRSHGYRSFADMLFRRDPADGSSLTEAIACMKEILHRCRPEMVIIPVGAGGHVDHRLSRDACLEAGPLTILLYEERPYCFVQDAVRLALAELGATDRQDVTSECTLERAVDRHARSFFKAHYNRKLLKSRDRGQVAARARDAVRLAHQPLKPVTPQPRIYPSEILDTLCRVAACYGSQLPVLFGSEKGFSRMCSRYAGSLGHPGRYVECFWSID